MSEVYLVFILLQTTRSRWGTHATKYAKLCHGECTFPRVLTWLRTKLVYFPFAMLQCSIYFKKIYTPRGVCKIKRQGGCFLEPTLLCPEMQETGKFSCTSLCKAELAESQTVFGGWGSLGENKPLKVLGFFLYFGTLLTWRRQFRPAYLWYKC